MKRSSIVYLIVSMAIVMWVIQMRRLQQGQRSLEEARLNGRHLQEQILQAETDMEESTEQRFNAQRLRDGVLAQTVTVETSLAEEDPEHYWVEPPAVWPSWNKASPYVWLRKEDLGTLRAPVFSKQGRLRGDVAEVLTMDKEQLRVVNSSLADIVNQHHALELEHVERVEEPLPGVIDGPHVTVRVEPIPEEARRLRDQFESVLFEELGAQRAEVLLQSGESWMNKLFNVSDREPKTYSVVRHPNGTFNISVRGPNHSSSFGGPIELKHHLPEHVLPLFDELMVP